MHCLTPKAVTMMIIAWFLAIIMVGVQGVPTNLDPFEENYELRCGDLYRRDDGLDITLSCHWTWCVDLFR
ncbi:uncharacterized protein N7483_009651 [Penicillium malachiteum]|uniref:uncharacterized protein n=1 Tax=Penicillium malachiteum TaxID=1324776 RepID=UPI0025490BAB|nr:uncharacterized protein N7483_009651 [Penicillium malachiteum]KAJ5721717.1 hypothetical protein N7483_009651 [Penicillium malachiteum]